MKISLVSHLSLAVCVVLLFGLSPSVFARVQTCGATWSAAASRMSAYQLAETEGQPVPLKFLEISDNAYERFREVPREEVAATAPPYVIELLKEHPELPLHLIVEEAQALRYDAESLLRQEADYWHLRHQHLWGGGLQHPRFVRRLAALELRATYVEHMTGRAALLEQRKQALTEALETKLRDGKLDERLEAVTQLAEIGDERSLQLLDHACRNDEKLAVRSSARLLLLAKGRPVNYDTKVIQDIRKSRIGDEEGYNLAFAELARLPDEALDAFLSKSRLKILDSNGMEKLFANRSLEFIEKYLNHEESWIRGNALRGLHGRYGPQYRALFEKALGDRSPYVAQQAVEGLAMSSDPASRALLMATARRHEDFGVRLRAKNLLEQAAGDWVPETTLRAQLASDKATAIAAATHLKTRDLGLVTTGLASPYPEVRLLAAEALRGRRDPEAVELAQEIFHPANEPVVEVRLAALDALSDSRTVIGDRAIAKAHSDPAPRIREAAMTKTHELGLANPAVQQAKKLVHTERTKLAQYESGRVPVSHRVAREAAEHVYDLPEAAKFANAQDLVTAQTKFLAGAPRGQRIVLAGSDPTNGFKCYYSVPRPGFESQPRVFSVAGTEGMMDVYADLHLGQRQLQSPIFARARERLLRDLAAGHDVDITGHSLGGMPAGVLAYSLYEATKSLPNAGKVRLITWNGLGAKDVIEWHGGFRPEVANGIEATNYHTPGDIVWRLANRYGTDVALPGNSRFRPISAHVMASITQAVERNVEPGAALQPTFRPVARVLPYVAQKLGWIGDLMQNFRYRRTEMQTLRTLLTARVEWARRQGYKELSPDVDPWRDEVEIIKESFRARNYEAGLKLISTYEAMRDAVLAAKQKPT